MQRRRAAIRPGAQRRASRAFRAPRPTLVAVALALGVAAAAHAESPLGTFVIDFGPELGVWNVSGSTTQDLSSPDFDGSLEMDVLMDGRGRFDGSGALGLTVFDPGGDVDVIFPDVDVKGDLRARSGRGKLRMRARMTGQASQGFLVIPLRGTLDFRGVLVDGVATGTTRVSFRAPRVRPVTVEVAQALDLRSGPGDDGSWTLTLTLTSPDGRRLEGFASVQTSNPGAPPMLFRARGRYDAKRDEARLVLRGDPPLARGATLKMKHLTSDGADLLGGAVDWKLLGQQGRALLVDGVPVAP